MTTQRVTPFLRNHHFRRFVKNALYTVLRLDKQPVQDITEDPFKVKSILLRKNMSANLVIFDVGAHEGTVTRRYRALLPKAQIYAFEPFIESFDKLSNNFQNDSLVSIQHIAFSAENTQATLNVNASVMTNSLLATDESGPLNWRSGLLETEKQQVVDVLTIDYFCKKQNIEHINLLKLDIQGAELLALRGAETLLRRQDIDLIYCEVILVPTYKNQSSFHELLAFTHNFDYELFGIYNLCHNKLRLNQVDVIFTSKNFLQKIEE